MTGISISDRFLRKIVYTGGVMIAASGIYTWFTSHQIAAKS
jgi:hypothetical protein